MKIFGCVIPVLIAVLAAGCANTPQGPVTTTERRPLEGDTIMVAGRPVAVRQTGARDPFEESGVVAFAGCPCERWGDADDRDIFRGCARRKVKVALVPLNPQSTFAFESVVDLKARIAGESAGDWAMSDEVMRDLTPPLTCDPTKNRRAVERKNVSVDAFLYAASKEDDNDFHLIIGDANCNSADCFLNVEISAMPKPSSTSFAAIENARIGFFELLGGEEPGDRYVEFEPFPVTVSGSLFFDVDHRAGQVGSPCCKPDTSWEIHPVRSIVARTD